MDALEFAKELNRMCESHAGCSTCEIHTDSKCVGNHFVNMNKFDEIVPIVEKWSAEHPIVTNLDHYAEALKKIGYDVDKEYLREHCPVHKNTHYTKGICKEKMEDCTACRKWWNEEYKEQKE